MLDSFQDWNIMDISTTQTEINMKIKFTTQELQDLNYALIIVRLNQNTEDDPVDNKQSVRAYKLLDKLFSDLNIK